MNDEPIIVYGAFSSGWSYLASRRAALLAAAALQVDWRIVEAETGYPDPPSDLRRFETMRGEMEQVVSILLPGERLPYSLAGFLTNTGAAVTAYAQAYDLGVSSLVRRLLFQAFWVHAIDLDDVQSVRTLMMDTLPELTRSGTGSPRHGTRPAKSLISKWADEWDDLGRPLLPALVVQGRVRHCADEAAAWFGTELIRRDVDIDYAQSRRRWGGNSS